MLDQIAKFLGSPLLALVVALLLGALAVSGRFSGLAANLCLVAAFAVASVAIAGSSLLDLRLKIGAMFGIAAICLGISYLISPSRTSQAALRAGVRSAVIYDGPGNLSLFMVGYQSMYGATTSPVFYLLNLSILNSTPTPITVEDYSVTVGDTQKGPWEELMPISLLSTKLYALGITAKGGGGGTMAIPRGAYRLGTPMKPEDMTRVATTDPVPKLELELRDKQLAPNQTVGGWAAFDLKDHEKRGVRNYFRIVVRDSTGRSYSSVVETPRREPGDSESGAQIGTLNVLPEPIADLSGTHVRYYSDPYPASPSSP